MGNGLAVFGGAAAPANSQDEDEPWVTTEGVVGLFSAATLPLGGGRNTSGWAAWAGTSFATPIAAALAADVLTRDPTLRPARVIERLREYAQISDDPLDRDGPLDCPTIVATQLPAAPATGA